MFAIQGSLESSRRDLRSRDYSGYLSVEISYFQPRIVEHLANFLGLADAPRGAQLRLEGRRGLTQGLLRRGSAASSGLAI